VTTGATMRLEVVTPGRPLLDQATPRVRAEGPQGSFTLLPRHVDLVTSLVPGLVIYEVDGEERMLAVDGGVLVKRGRSVRVATRAATAGTSVLGLHRAMLVDFEETTEAERRSRAALTRLETDAIRRLIELEHDV
jgi:F-type H+-transporting ATPase subunit epsilon